MYDHPRNLKLKGHATRMRAQYILWSSTAKQVLLASDDTSVLAAPSKCVCHEMWVPLDKCLGQTGLKTTGLKTNRTKKQVCMHKDAMMMLSQAHLAQWSNHTLLIHVHTIQEDVGERTQA